MLSQAALICYPSHFFPATFFENLSCLGFTRFSLSSLFWKKTGGVRSLEESRKTKDFDDKI